MALWTIYFAVKAYLYFEGTIRFDVALNAVFLAFLAMPVPERLRHARTLGILKLFISIIAGILLFWHDSWLPAPLAAYELLKQHGLPTAEYVYHFLLRLYHPAKLAGFTALLVACILLRRYKKTLLAGSVLLVLLPLVISRGEASSQSAGEVAAYRDSFFDSEVTRVVRFRPRTAKSGDFDIIVLHICSISWDDLRELNLEEHPFFKQFDYLFTNFNTVTTYSNPAVIRMLNANCGQRKHDDLYTDIPKECALFESLRLQGDEIYFVRNHNGKYGKFDEEARRFGHMETAPFATEGLSADKFMFDDSPVYGDFAVLDRWLAVRQRSGAKSAAVYYNGVSLHEGTHWIGEKNWWKRDHREQYREFMKEFIAGMQKFLDRLAASGRDTVVVFVPEHGRAIRGSTISPAGLRDIPTPRTTTVPVGIKFIGKTLRRDPAKGQIIVSKPVSYFALSYLIQAFRENSPFVSDRYAFRSFLDGIPQTDFVAENQKNLIILKDGNYYYFGKDEKWVLLTPNEL